MHSSVKLTWSRYYQSPTLFYGNNQFYYINTNEISGELSRENLISSHVKISPLPWLHNKSRLSHQKTIKLTWFGISLVFIIINRTLHGRLEIRNFFSRVEKIFHLFAALTHEHSERNFVSPCGHVISSVYDFRKPSSLEVISV